MNRAFAGLSLVVVLGAGALAQAPEEARLRYPEGATLSYRIEYGTVHTHAVKDFKTEVKSQVKVTKRWKVEAVQAGGATLSLSLTDMQQERTSAAGTVLKFDSKDVEGSSPEMRGMAKMLDKPLAEVRVDALGRVAEVKSGDANSFELEPPFIGSLPTGALKAGSAWERAFTITLAPPVGTGEKHAAVQKFVCESVKDGVATVSIVTELKAKPKAAADMVPLWQAIPKGTLEWDLKAGRLLSATLKVEEELKDHDGPGSHARFSSTKTIKLLP